MESTSTWFALRNRVFLRVWLATILSATFVSVQDVTATWLMHDLGASFSLSLMATATSTPLFLFSLPAGVIADIVNRRIVILGAVAWQAACSAVLALAAWTQVIAINSVLVCIFALGIGIAFTAPVWGAVVPDIVSKDELPSAITLGGVQMNVAGIVGPALGGFLLPLVGRPSLFAISSMTFLIVAVVVLPWKPPKKPCKEVSPELRRILDRRRALRQELHADTNYSMPKFPLFPRHLCHASASAGDHVRRIEMFSPATWACVHLRGGWIPLSGGAFSSVP